MKDQCLFELVLARLLGCHDETLSEPDQREAILTAVCELQLVASDLTVPEPPAVAVDPRAQEIERWARNLLGAYDQQTWDRCKLNLTEALSRNGSVAGT